MNYRLRYILSFGTAMTALLFASLPGTAADIWAPREEIKEVIEPVAQVGTPVIGSLSVYGWLPWVSGKTGINGLGPVDVSLGPDDILKNLKMVFLGSGEVRLGQWGLWGDLIYMDMGANTATPGAVYSNASLDIAMTIATAAGTFQLYDTGESWIQAVAGARYWSIDSKLDLTGGGGPFPLNPSASDDITWIDPMIGLRGRHALNEDWLLTGAVLVGGFGVGSSFSWDLFGGVGYKLTDSATATFGFRAIGVDYSKNGDVVDVINYGPLTAITWSF